MGCPEGERSQLRCGTRPIRSCSVTFAVFLGLQVFAGLSPHITHVLWSEVIQTLSSLEGTGHMVLTRALTLR